MKTTYKDIGRPGTRAEEHERTETVSRQSGKSYCYVRCPFCRELVKTYIWSLSGGGKRCPCGALHVGGGFTYKKADPAEEQAGG